MQNANRSRFSFVAEQAQRFLKKNVFEIQKTPADEVRALITELLNCLYQGKEQSTASTLRPLHSVKSPFSFLPAEGQLCINQKGFIVAADPSIALMLGMEPQKLKQHPIQKFIQRDAKKAFNQHCLDGFKKGAVQFCRLPVITGGGSAFVALLKISPQSEKGSGPTLKIEVQLERKTS